MDIVLQPLRLGSMKMVVLFKPLPVTIWDKTLPKCSVLNLKTKRNKKVLFGKPVGGLQPDRSVSWLCNTVMTKVSSYHQESLKSKPSSSQFHSKEKKKWLTKHVRNYKPLLSNLTFVFTTTIETTTIRDGNTIIGNWRVFQSDLNLVQKISKRMKSDVYWDTMVKKCNCQWII